MKHNKLVKLCKKEAGDKISQTLTHIKSVQSLQQKRESHMIKRLK